LEQGALLMPTLTSLAFVAPLVALLVMLLLNSL
jgi:hypothetical protein